MSEKNKITSVNYLLHRDDRRKMTNYLRTGNFKKIAGSPIYNRSVKKRRILLTVIASLIFVIGIYYVIF